MPELHESVSEYREQLKKGAIQHAYRGIMEYIMGLRTYFNNRCPDYAVSSNLYFGYMDMTYFACFPPALKERKLKIAVVFLHEEFRFEVWLAAANKQVQTQYWKQIKDSGWDKYRLVPSTQGADSIIEHVLVDGPDFRDLDALTRQIEEGTLAFIQDVEKFVLKQQNPTP